MTAERAAQPQVAWWQRRGTVAVMAVLAALVTIVVHGWRADLLGAIVLAFAGVYLAVEDFSSHRLPNAVLAPTAIAVATHLTVLALTGDRFSDLLRAFVAAAACGAGYLVLALARPTGLGMGDVKLGALLGLWLGWLGWGAVVLGVLAGFLLGGVAALALLATGRATRRSALAFGPWLLLGAAVASAVTVRMGDPLAW